jgi:hypothetical protein
MVSACSWWLWHVSHRDTAHLVRTGDRAELLVQLHSHMAAEAEVPSPGPRIGTGLTALVSLGCAGPMVLVS